MLASQLCVFDEKTDSKSKLVEKKQKNSWHGRVARIVYFVNISICDCDALSEFNDDACKVKVQGITS